MRNGNSMIWRRCLTALAALVMGSSLLWRSALAGPSATNGLNSWALQPLVKPPMPLGRSSAARTHPIDAFISQRLAQRGLGLSPAADRRTLLRRLSFDLIGLPPTPEEVAAFTEDPRPDAYARLVDRLLDSPRYGERWARHWLDVVHYGETHGYDKDKPRPNAWPYRDYVIRAFNEDKPYTRFVQEQLAGDVLFPGTRDGLEALGFIAAGPWDLIGHEEVPETKIDGKIARHLDRDDMVATTMQTFNSLTVQCAQCHDHKFDPISQEDYYSLQAVFAAVDRTNKKYDPAPAVARRREQLETERANLQARLKELDDTWAARAGARLLELDQKIAAAAKGTKKGEAYGYHSAIEPKPDSTKWVEVDLGRELPIGRIVLHPCKDDFNGIGEGFGFPVRFKVELSSDPGFARDVQLVADKTGQDAPNPKIAAQSFDAAGRVGRYVRVTATQLALRQNDYIFALAELEVLTSDGKNAALGGSVTALDSIEAPGRWQKSNLTDAWYPGVNLEQLGELPALREERHALLERAKRPDERAARTALADSLAQVKAAADKLPPLSTVYIGAVHTGSGAFAGTGAKGGAPRSIFLLARGNVQKPEREVGPGALSCLSNLPARFALSASHPEGERRAALARWLTGTNNPLTWRSIVNRIWQCHFGRGLCETPNDFGRMGAAPTHPELLDWLACEFRERGQSLKALHKLIVTSATYCQSSVGTEFNTTRAAAAGEVAHPDAAQLDADNRLLWRQNRRKLEAEAVRDAVLAVSGKLNLSMGGPSFQDFVIEKPEHSPHYEYQLFDPEAPSAHRRSIYRFIVRSQPQPFMTTLDCADPSMQVGRRNESVSPLQALTLLNNDLMVTMAKHFAARVERDGGDTGVKVARAFSLALARSPQPNEAAAMAAYAQQFGMTNLCRALFNLNEFAFVD
jgi:hypothetical protein